MTKKQQICARLELELVKIFSEMNENPDDPGPGDPAMEQSGYVHKLKKAWMKEYTTKEDADQVSNSTSAVGRGVPAAVEEHGLPAAGPAQAVEGQGDCRTQDKRPGENRGQPGEGHSREDHEGAREVHTDANANNKRFVFLFSFGLRSASLIVVSRNLDDLK